MTISTQISRIDYLGNGVTTSFPVPFTFFGLDELQVVERKNDTGDETVLTRGSAYSVTGGGGAVGTVTAAVAPAATVQWTIRRVTAATQLTDYVEGDAFPAQSHEIALDRLTALVQELAEADSRTVRVPVTDPTSSLILPPTKKRTNRFLAFDGNGQFIASRTQAGGFPVTDFAATFLDDVSAAAVRLTLDVPSQAELAAARAEQRWKLLSGGGVFSGVSQIVVTVPAATKVIRYTLCRISVVGEVSILLQGSVDGGATFLASGYTYQFWAGQLSSPFFAAGNVAREYFDLTGGIQDSRGAVSGNIYVNATGLVFSAERIGVGSEGGSIFWRQVQTAGGVDFGEKVNAIRFFVLSGTFGGTLYLEAAE